MTIEDQLKQLPKVEAIRLAMSILEYHCCFPITLKEFGQLIRQKRETKGLTRWEMAGLAGLGESSIQCWELGSFNIKQESFARLCSFLEIDHIEYSDLQR